MYRVYKFFPPRCPKCEHPFRSSEDFALWLGRRGNSFATALKNQRELFSEIFPKATKNKLIGYTNKFDIDFIICTHCQNTTLRIDYASRQVATREEAEALIEIQGFTGWHEVQAVGNMARPFTKLALLGQAELMVLQKSVEEARRQASKTHDEVSRVNVFATALDPVLVEIVNKIRQEQETLQVRERLQSLFGPLWREVTLDCQNFLITAEVTKDELMSYSEAETAMDFTPAVQMYSVALEKEILDKIFVAFRDSRFSPMLPEPTGNNSLARSLEALRAFVAKRRTLTLGDMAYCLRNVGCKLRSHSGNGFVSFLREVLVNLDAVCDKHRFPSQIIKYTENYRNRAAHVSRLSLEDCLGARAFLLEEPTRLLVTLEEAFKR